jgi:hypothetical protein
MSQDDAGAALEALIELVAATRRAQAAGVPLDLTGLDLEVERVCRALTGSPPHEGRAVYLAKLEALAVSLNELTADMKEAHP